MTRATATNSAAATAIENRQVIADHAAEWMQNHCPSWSIDTLLTWPARAEAMARYVCRRLQRKATEQNIHEVLRAALSSRKRGDLKRDRD